MTFLYIYIYKGYDMAYPFKINSTQKINPTQIKINPKIKPNFSLLPLHALISLAR